MSQKLENDLSPVVSQMFSKERNYIFSVTNITKKLFLNIWHLNFLPSFHSRPKKNFSWVVGSIKVFYPIFRSNASKAKKLDYRLWQSKTKAKGSNKKGFSRMFDFQNNNVHSLRLWLGTNTLNTCEFEITSSQFLVDQPLRITVEATNILRNTKIL